MKRFHWHNWLKLPQSLADRARRSRCAPRRQYSSKPVVEGLEERVVPAFDLTVGAGQATSNVSSISVLGTTIFAPTASGAFLNANDILTALNSGNVKVTSGDAGTEAGNITIAAGLTGPNGLNNALTFTSGTGVNLVGNITVNADLVAGTGGTLPLTVDATGTLTLNADLNSGPAAMALAAANGSIVQTSGTVENTTGLSLSAHSGIGSSATALQTRVNNLVAETATGGIFINNSNNPGPLTIGFTGDPFHGIQITGASGDIQIVNDNSIAINGNGEVVKGPGNVTLKANGASSSIVTGGNNGSTGPAIQAGVALTLSAGQDILIGDTGALTRGDVVGVTSVSITASRNVIVDQGSILASGNAANPGSLTVTATGDISVLGNGGSAAIETQNGPINLTTGVGGTFTNDSANGVDSNVGGSAGGAITINADNIVLGGIVNAGVGIVTLQQATTTMRAIDLGAGTTSGAFNINNADLAEITAGMVRIGRTDNSGSIVVTAPVTSQPGFSTLSLRTGGSTTETGTGAISVTKLAIDSFGDVDLSTNASAVSGLAAVVRNLVNFGGTFAILDSVSLTVGTIDGVVGVNATGGVTIASSMPGTALTVNNVVNTPSSGSFGTIAFTFDNMTFAAMITSGTIKLNEFSRGQLIDLGGANASGTLGLSAASLAHLFGFTVQIGDGATGNVSVSVPFGFNKDINQSQVVTLIVDSGAAILNTGGSLTAPQLALKAVTGIGTSTPLATAVTDLAFFNSTSGAVQVTNSGNVNVAVVGSLSTSSNLGGATTLTAVAAPLTVGAQLNFGANTTSSGNLTANATIINVNANVSVSSTTGNALFEASGVPDFPSGVSLLAHSLVQAAAITIHIGMNGKGTALIQGTLETDTGRNFIVIQGKSSGGNSLTIDYAHGATLPDGLSYDGGSGSANGLLVTDEGDGASNNTFDIDALRVIHNNEQPIAYSHVSAVTVFGGNLSNTFTVTPEVSLVTGKPTVTFFIEGGASGGAQVPPVSATNTLIYNAVGAPVGTFGGSFNGGVSELGSRLVIFEFISVIHLDNTAAVNAQTGPDSADRGTAFNGLNANERFVQALYLDALRRAGSKAELDSWAALFSTPNSTKEQIQALIATGINHSLEARDALVKGWYVAYLGRPAVNGEESFWVAELLLGATQEQVLSQILGSAEFFNRAQILVSSGSPQERFVQALYLVLLYRTGAATEVQAWVNILPAFGTQGVAAAFLASTEFREYQFQGYYNTLFFRPSDTDGLLFWANSGANFDAVLINFESTSEFYTNG